jgi:hypothetical protein
VIARKRRAFQQWWEAEKTRRHWYDSDDELKTVFDHMLASRRGALAIRAARRRRDKLIKRYTDKGFYGYLSNAQYLHRERKRRGWKPKR